MSDRLGNLQAWLQGNHPYARHRPWPLWWLGNRISEYRFWRWTRSEEGRAEAAAVPSREEEKT